MSHTEYNTPQAKSRISFLNSDDAVATCVMSKMLCDVERRGHSLIVIKHPSSEVYSMVVRGEIYPVSKISCKYPWVSMGIYRYPIGWDSTKIHDRHTPTSPFSLFFAITETSHHGQGHDCTVLTEHHPSFQSTFQKANLCQHPRRLKLQQQVK